MRVVAEAFAEPSAQGRAHRLHIGQEIVASDRLLHGERGGAGHGMGHIGVAVLEEARAAGEGVVDVVGQQHRADRLVAAAQPLGNGHQVGRDAFLLAGVQGAGATHAAHHLVEDQEHAVAVADLADALEIAGRRRHRAGRGTDHCFGHESHHRFRPEFEYLGFERIGGALAIGCGALARLLEMVGKAGIDMVRLDQERRELRTAPLVAASR